MNPEDISKIANLICQKVNMQPRWLKTNAAAKYSGIGVARLKSLAGSGQIVGYKDPESARGDWIFDRESIDQYRLQYATDFKSKALDILATL